MKGHSVSLGLYLSHEDRLIAVSAAPLVNAHWQPQTETDYLGEWNTMLLVPDADVIASVEV